ncbi:MAG: phage head-tail joining protein [Glycocaulis sp.]
MATLADMRKWRDALIEGRASGVREFQDSNGERVVYRSVRELNAAIASLDAEIARMTGQRAPSTIVFRTSKGL